MIFNIRKIMCPELQHLIHLIAHLVQTEKVNYEMVPAICDGKRPNLF